MPNKPLGRRVPTDFTHFKKYPYQLAQAVNKVEKILPLPYWHQNWNQGSEGACVGFGSSMERTITNMAQARKNNIKPFTKLYDPKWLWNEAKKIDEWSDSNPGDNNGTSVRAAYDVLRTQGHIRVRGKKKYPVSLNEGVTANRWAFTVDDMRNAIANDAAISFGCNWYTNFDNPSRPFTKEKDYWISTGDLGSIRGGHDVCIFGASDRRQAFIFKNSWGGSYPLTWMPYETVQRLLNEYAESCLVTDY